MQLVDDDCAQAGKERRKLGRRSAGLQSDRASFETRPADAPQDEEEM